MKLALFTGLAALGLCFSAAAADTTPKAAPATGDAAAILKSDVDKFSYSIGLNWGNQFRAQSIDLTPDVLMRGLFDGLSNKPALMTQPEIQAAIDQMRKDVTARNEVRMKEMKTKNQEAADKFLAENGKKPGIKTTA